MRQIVLILGLVPILTSGHALEGKYHNMETQQVFEIDHEGLVITDLNASADFWVPSGIYAAPVTVLTPLRKYHPNDPFTASGSIAANGCSFGATLSVSQDPASKHLNVLVTHSQQYRIEKYVCYHTVNVISETHRFEIEN